MFTNIWCHEYYGLLISLLLLLFIHIFFYFASSYQQTGPHLTSRPMSALDLWCRPCTNDLIPGYSAAAGCRHTALAPWGPPAPGPPCGQLLAVLFIAISTGYGLPATLMPLGSSWVLWVPGPYYVTTSCLVKYPVVNSGLSYGFHTVL